MEHRNIESKNESGKCYVDADQTGNIGTIFQEKAQT